MALTSCQALEEVLLARDAAKKEDEVSESPSVIQSFPLSLLGCEAPKRLNLDWWTLQSSLYHRLTLLQTISKPNASEDINRLLIAYGFVPLRYEGAALTEDHVQRDVVSHFFMRIALRANPPAREWLVHQETALLSLRLHQYTLPAEFWSAVLEKFGIPNKRLSERGLPPDLRHNVMTTLPHSRSAAGLGGALYMVPFSPGADWLVKRKMVYLRQGIAYVPQTLLIDGVILPAFSKIMWSSLDQLKAQNGIIEAGLRDVPSTFGTLLRQVSDNYLGPKSERVQRQDGCVSLNLKNLELMSVKSFPPCMRLLYDMLKKHHHLKHHGRMQLWLFLKGAGMTVEDQLRWWGSLWANNKVFEKEIRYNIRHAYGLEGKRTSYSCFNCRKIITGPRPGNGEFHGCPFASTEINTLKKYLAESYKIPQGELSHIGQLINSRDYQLACLRVFAYRHDGSTGDSVGNHPLTWYEESCFHGSGKF